MTNREQRRDFEDFVEDAVEGGDAGDQPLNRELRRHPERIPTDEAPPHEDAPPKAPPIEQQGPPEVESTRAKSQRHKKTTAENWNQ